jgi:hypothetical protein
VTRLYYLPQMTIHLCCPQFSHRASRVSKFNPSSSMQRLHQLAQSIMPCLITQTKTYTVQGLSSPAQRIKSLKSTIKYMNPASKTSKLTLSPTFLAIRFISGSGGCSSPLFPQSIHGHFGSPQSRQRLIAHHHHQSNIWLAATFGRGFLDSG